MSLRKSWITVSRKRTYCIKYAGMGTHQKEKTWESTSHVPRQHINQYRNELSEKYIVCRCFSFSNNITPEAKTKTAKSIEERYHYCIYQGQYLPYLPHKTSIVSQGGAMKAFITSIISSRQAAIAINMDAASWLQHAMKPSSNSVTTSARKPDIFKHNAWKKTATICSWLINVFTLAIAISFLAGDLQSKRLTLITIWESLWTSNVNVSLHLCFSTKGWVLLRLQSRIK